VNLPRSLVLIAAGVLALVVITVVVVLISGNRQSAEFADGTPEAVLQDYLAAVEDGDLDAAYAYFSTDVRTQMDRDSFVNTVAMYDQGGADRRRRALFEGRLGEGDSVRLVVTVEELYGEGLNTSTNRYEREVRMIHQPEGWRIDEPLVWLEPAPIQAAP
jgi:hypothetical protein